MEMSDPIFAFGTTISGSTTTITMSVPPTLLLTGSHSRFIIPLRQSTPDWQRIDMVEDGTPSSSQYIEMDLAMHSNGWDSSPCFRKLQKPSESREFEFTIATTQSTDVYQQSSLHLVPADELFFRGKLLPLQPDPRLRLLQALTCLNRRPMEDEDEAGGNEDLAMETDKLYSPDSVNDDMQEEGSAYLHAAANGTESFFSLHCAYRVRIANATEESKSEESSKNDWGSSSFRSQQSSNYWSYGERESRDSMSSSRYSDGSCQDFCPLFLHHDITMAPSLSSVFCTTKANAGMAQEEGILLKAKKWSWKVLRGGMRTASKVLGHEQKGPASGARTSVSRSRDGDCGAKPSADYRFPGYISGGRKDLQYQKKDRSGNISEFERQSSSGRNAAKEAWVRYVGKVKRPHVLLYGRRMSFIKNRHSSSSSSPPSPPPQMSKKKEESSGSETQKMKSWSWTPSIRSPHNKKGDPETRLGGHGFIITSCPASMSSSPNHSGVLAVINNNKSDPASLDELHNAIQGAISHCKQSQQGK